MSMGQNLQVRESLVTLESQAGINKASLLNWKKKVWKYFLRKSKRLYQLSEPPDQYDEKDWRNFWRSIGFANERGNVVSWEVEVNGNMSTDRAVVSD